jgi:hypothetical protein
MIASNLRPELLPGIGVSYWVLPGPAKFTGSHIVNRGTCSPTGTAAAECPGPGEEEPWRYSDRMRRLVAEKCATFRFSSSVQENHGVATVFITVGKAVAWGRG